MRLTNESPRARWLIMLAVWVFVAGNLAWHSHLIGRYVAHLDALGRGNAAVTTPLHRPIPSNFMDALEWTRHALAIQEGAPRQVRFTTNDNAPEGRELHWHSGLAHVIAVAGRIEQWRGGGTLPEATERALGWINLTLMLGLVVLFSATMAQWAGAGAGMLVALGMLGSHDFYAGFMPNYVDHHGLLTTAAFGVVLGVLVMGAGWRIESGAASVRLLPLTQAEVRRGAIFSAICGAVGMWISAATAIPPIAITGLAAVVVVWFGGPAARACGAVFDAGAWRLWGRLGAGLSVFFYLLEYAPSHLGLRLEVNHPLHALAWWGGAEIVAWLAEWRLAENRNHPALLRLALPLLAIAAAPATIAAFGTKVFLAGDPFVAQLSASVAEGISQLAAWRIYGWAELKTHCNTQLLPLIPAVWLIWRRRPAERLVLGFALAAASLTIAMSLWKIRWWPNASGPIICVLLAGIALIPELNVRRRWWLVLVAGAVCYVPDLFNRFAVVNRLIDQHAAQPVDVLQPLFRDVAAALRATQPKGDIVLLSSPNSSMGIGYYGRFKTVGTLFWENVPGLRKTAEIFSAQTDAEAFDRIRACGVTHVAMISEENYLADLFSLLHPTAPLADLKQTFGYRILFEYRLPIWLEAVPYRIPENVRLPKLVVRLFRISPDQSVPEAYWHLGESELAAGELLDGEAKLERAIMELPAEVRLAQRVIAGNACYQFGAHAGAVRFFRAALAEREDPAVAQSLMWVLATSTENSVRNGPAALALAERAAPPAGTRDFGFDSNLAAALAENGRFAEAIEAATRAVEGALAAGNKVAAELNQQRLAAYRAGRAWRQ